MKFIEPHAHMVARLTTMRTWRRQAVLRFVSLPSGPVLTEAVRMGFATTSGS